MTDAVAQEAQPQAQPVQESAAQPTPEKRKVKIDGVEQEVEVDTVLKDYQKFKAADKRFQEAASLKKQADQIMQMVEKGKTAGDLSSLVDQVGEQNFRKYAEKWLWDKIQFEEMPEEKREAILNKQRADRAEAEAKSLKDSIEQEKISAQKSQAYQEIDREISEAIKGLGRKPTPRLIARLAETMAASLSNEDGERLDAKSALQRTVSEMNSDLREYVTQLSAEEAIELLPKETLDAVRKLLVANAQTQVQNRTRQQASQAPAPKRPKSMTTDEYFKNLERRLG
jgi:hypothetical protein